MAQFLLTHRARAVLRNIWIWHNMGRNTWRTDGLVLLLGALLCIVSGHTLAGSASSLLGDKRDAAAAVSRPGSSSSSGLGGTDALLDPLVAFVPKLRVSGGSGIEVRFDVAPNYYLYRDRLRMVQHVQGVGRMQSTRTAQRVSETAKAATPAAPEKPSMTQKSRSSPGQVEGHALKLTLSAGRMVDDPTFGNVEVMDRQFVIRADLDLEAQPARKAQPAKGSTGEPASAAASAATDSVQALEIIVHSQGCAAAGVCFPPQTHRFEISRAQLAAAGAQLFASSAVGSPAARAPVSEWRNATQSGSLSFGKSGR
jgi:thiol:disulfide interchange protein